MKIYTLLIPLALSACAVVATADFDPNEYGSWIETSYAAKQAKSLCGKQDMTSVIEVVQHAAGFAALYSGTKPLNQRVANGAAIIVNLTDDLRARYALDVPSTSYCQLKLTEIDVAARTIATSLSKKEM